VTPCNLVLVCRSCSGKCTPPHYQVTLFDAWDSRLL